MCIWVSFFRSLRLFSVVVLSPQEQTLTLIASGWEMSRHQKSQTTSARWNLFLLLFWNISQKSESFVMPWSWVRSLSIKKPSLSAVQRPIVFEVLLQDAHLMGSEFFFCKKFIYEIRKSSKFLSNPKFVAVFQRLAAFRKNNQENNCVLMVLPNWWTKLDSLPLFDQKRSHHQHLLIRHLLPRLLVWLLSFQQRTVIICVEGMSSCGSDDLSSRL